MEKRKCVTLGRGYAYISRGKEKLWVPSKLIKIRHEKGRSPLMILAVDKGKEIDKIKKRGDTYSDFCTQR